MAYPMPGSTRADSYCKSIPHEKEGLLMTMMMMTDDDDDVHSDKDSEGRSEDRSKAVHHSG